MTKKDYQLFADAISQIKNKEDRERMIEFVGDIFSRDNYRFDEERFREWIKRRIEGKSLKGLRYNPKYTLLGVK